MLIACQSCHRQYDVQDLDVGAKVRCICSELLEVKEVKPKDMAVLRCTACGGQVAKDDKDCGFCGNEISLAERGFGGSCPECFARMPKNAKFCSNCGVGIAPVGKLQPLHDKSCPRCDSTLAVQEVGDQSLVECTGCGGLWLEEEEFTRITKDTEKDAVSRFVKRRAEKAPVEPPAESTVRYLKCPTCSEIMHRKNFASASGVIIDWCRGHGYWFDRHELEQIIKFISEGGLDAARDRQLEIQKSEARTAQSRRAAADVGRSTAGFDVGGSHVDRGILGEVVHALRWLL